MIATIMLFCSHVSVSLDPRILCQEYFIDCVRESELTPWETAFVECKLRGPKDWSRFSEADGN